MSTGSAPHGTHPEGPREGALGASGAGVRTWTNWAGNQSCRARLLRPTSEPELCRIVAEAAARGHTVRAVGSGHSFSDVALSDSVLVDLSAYDRVLAIDRDASTVTVQSGARLADLSRSSWPRGLAFTNLGDIDVQPVAGATQTATHGTGVAFGNLSSAVVGMRLIDGTGTVRALDADHEPALFAAARAGLGALGLVSTATLAMSPAFNLHAVHDGRVADRDVAADAVGAVGIHVDDGVVLHVRAVADGDRRVVPANADAVPDVDVDPEAHARGHGRGVGDERRPDTVETRRGQGRGLRVRHGASSRPCR